MSEERAPPGLRFGAIVNPNSRRNRKRPPDIAALRADGIVVEAPRSVGEAAASLRRMALAGVETLAIDGGDGAVLSAMTAMLRDGIFERPPILCLLPGGTTNMTAADVGFGRGASVAAAAALAERGGGHIVKRNALLLEGARDSAGETAPHVGMFFGAIGICRAILYCRKHLHRHGIVGGASSWLTLAPLLMRNLVSSDPDGVLAPAEATVRANFDDSGCEELEGPFALLMASTLERLALGARPFWSDGHGLDGTFVRAPVENLARNIRPLLYGGDRRPAEPGYVSRKAQSYEIAYTGVVTLDGELYQADADRPIRLSEAGEFRFLRP